MNTTVHLRVGTSSRRQTAWSIQRFGGPRYILVPSEANALVIEDSWHRQYTFLTRLGSRHTKIVNRSEAAIEALQRESFDWIFIDYDLALGRTTEEVARYLVNVQFSGSVVIHSTNPFGANVLEKILCDGGISNVEVAPFDVLGVLRERSFSETGISASFR